MAKLATLVVALLALLGSVACEGYYSSPNSYPALSPSNNCLLPAGWSKYLGLLPCSSSPSPTPDTSLPSLNPAPTVSKPVVGYYNKNGSCPRAEEIVREVVNNTIYYSKEGLGVGAGLIRLFFHDCFVRGCDASVLLDDLTGANTTEKFGGPNINSLRQSAFKVIDDAKTKLEAACPNKVSCADVIAFAARDASEILGNMKFPMPAGRLDGRVSLASEANQNLPGPGDNIDRLKKSFSDQGLDTNDLVVLSGAHSIGVARCRFFSFSDMDPAFAKGLNDTCTKNGGPDARLNQDYQTPDVLDSKYYDNVVARKVLFGSDAALKSPETIGLVNTFKGVQNKFEMEFAKAMVKMGNNINNNGGEIRKQCRRIN
ncbi:hypothetical protein ACP70R_005296 [Stipagrostis hirtigluma subsp. patula]